MGSRGNASRRDGTIHYYNAKWHLPSCDVGPTARKDRAPLAGGAWRGSVWILRMKPPIGWIGRLGSVWEDRLLGAFLAERPGAYRLAFFGLVAVVLVTLGLLFSFGCSHQWSCAWDSAFLLDGGWRILGGQRPHVDFYSPLGAVPLLVVALGMLVAGPRGAALTYGPAIVFPFVALAAWWVARRRLPALPALIFCLMVGFTLVATHYPGHPFHDTTYAAQYNRLGGALLAVLLVQVLLPPQEDMDAQSRSAAVLAGLCAGSILGLLLFTKITYFGMGVAAVALAGWSCFRRRIAAWVAVVGAGAAVWFCVMGYLGFDFAAFDADMKMLAAVQDADFRIVALANAVRWNRGPLGLLLVMMALLVRPMRRGNPDAVLSSWLLTATMALVAIFVGLFIYSTDGISGTPPAFAVAALVLAENLRRRCAISGPLRPETFEQGFKYLLASGLAACLAGVIIVHGSLSVAYSFVWHWLRADHLPTAAMVDSPTMGDVLLPPRADEARLADRQAVIASILQRDPDQPDPSSYQYACWTNDGLDLLRRHVDAKSRVFVMDWVNPFSFALELPSPRGDALYWHAGRVFDEAHHPDADRVFAEVTLVMVPKRPIQPASKRALAQVYGHVLQSRFEPIDESKLWTLYARRPNGDRPQHDGT